MYKNIKEFKGCVYLLILNVKLSIFLSWEFRVFIKFLKIKNSNICKGKRSYESGKWYFIWRVCREGRREFWIILICTE